MSYEFISLVGDKVRSLLFSTYTLLNLYPSNLMLFSTTYTVSMKFFSVLLNTAMPLSKSTTINPKLYAR